MACAVVATVTAGVTSGLFSATTNAQTSTVSAGSVSFGTPVTSSCSASGLLPGVTPTPCTLKATYSGSAPAYLGLDVVVATHAGAGGTSMFVPGDSTSLQVTVSDSSSTQFVTPSTTFGSALASCPATMGIAAGSTCYELTDLLVSTTPFGPTNPTDTFTTAVEIPATSPTGAQGSSAQVVLEVHAAQAGNQGLGSCTAGSACPGLEWS